MSFDLKHWEDLFSGAWKFATGGGAGFVIAKATDLHKWRQTRKTATEAAAIKARLLAKAKEQEKLYQYFLKEGGATGGLNTKNRTMWFQKTADAAKQTADLYREAGDVVNALPWDQIARNTVP